MQVISVGIDNGLYGAIVALDVNFRVVAYCDTPVVVLTKTKKGKKHNISDFTPAAMNDALWDVINRAISGAENYEMKAWLEVAQAMPQQGLSSTFKTGRGFGLWEGILAANHFRYDIVHPKTWTKTLLHDVPAGEPKQRTMIKAQRLFGSTLPLTKPHGRTLSLDGRADAALIAYYGMLQMRENWKGLIEAPKTTKTPVRKKVA